MKLRLIQGGRHREILKILPKGEVVSSKQQSCDNEKLKKESKAWIIVSNTGKHEFSTEESAKAFSERLDMFEELHLLFKEEEGDCNEKS